ncbi:Carbonic anhydrase [Plasmopara halstedii]|uniref:Carbonic anhydrase n=1 Tax=Plasmopara halstedii TaxID=4781 RepID=A0A0P1ASG1_PLAHL|nr:Carbonic anhydrase [Plasmopara halstedii]CEG44176.1 Carbonic anhydrase [Plasmopara halstedii]|eukprot:XP_024580545.1 Carbonic anhydrase [Plasmopara halstedii]
MPTSLERLSEKHKKWCEGKKLLDRIISTRQRKANVCDTCGPVAVPAEEITGFAPVELFIHRNVAKIVKHLILLEHWLRNIRDVQLHCDELKRIEIH